MALPVAPVRDDLPRVEYGRLFDGQREWLELPSLGLPYTPERLAAYRRATATVETH